MTSVSAAEPPASRQRIGWRLYAEYVPCAADRVEEARLTAGFQLSSQVGHEDLDRVGDREGVIAPDLVEQLLAADHQPLVAHQVLEQLELALREIDLPVATRDLVRIRVQRQVTHPQRGHPARWAAPQQGPQAGEQLLALERLDQIVVGADVEPLHAGLQGVARRQHEDRRVVAVVAQALGDVDAIQPRQAEIEHDDVRQEGVGLVKAADAVGGELDLVPLETQRALEDLRDLLIVLDDEHAHGTTG